MNQNKKLIIGPVGSGKTTLYRKLNEEKITNAVEIELPQSCINDEEIKEKLFDIFYNSPNIDVIISHPYYLPKDLKGIEIEFLEIPFQERIKRINNRNKQSGNDCKIFDENFLKEEEIYFNNFKKYQNNN